jgi:quercetin dioxygenase-like cupin family protein
MLPGQILYRATCHSARAVLLGATVLLASSCDEPGRAVSPTGTGAPESRFTVGQGSTPTFIGQATYTDLDKVKRITKGWHVELKAKGGLEVIVRSFAYSPGSFTGWHKHPGPVLIQVVEGTVTFFEADAPCTPIVVHAGQGYLDDGVQGHIGRNLSGVPAKDVTIYLAPPGTQVSQLRIDMPAPPGAEACS